MPSGAPRDFGRRLGNWLAREATSKFGWSNPRSLGPFGSLLRRTRATPADLTIVHNEVAHCVGLRLLDAGRRVAADIEDWHSEDLLPQDRLHRPLALIRANERALLHRAAYTTTTSQALADGLHARYDGRRFPFNRSRVAKPRTTRRRSFGFRKRSGRAVDSNSFSRRGRARSTRAAW
jgi:hypothetical protein